MITGIGVHDRTERAFKITGMLKLVHDVAHYIGLIEQSVAQGPLHPQDRGILQRLCACLGQTDDMA
jgi:hypothetical protein